MIKHPVNPLPIIEAFEKNEEAKTLAVEIATLLTHRYYQMINDPMLYEIDNFAETHNKTMLVLKTAQRKLLAISKKLFPNVYQDVHESYISCYVSHVFKIWKPEILMHVYDFEE